jgi:hypothetical protein
MCCFCQIVPQKVLKRFSADRSLSAEQRKNFADTMKIDVELRKLRTQAGKLTRVASLIAGPTTLARAVAAAPAITVYNSNNGQTLPAPRFPIRLCQPMRPPSAPSSKPHR